MKHVGPEHRFVHLDDKDKKILYALDVNARQSASEIGKKIGLSKHIVTYRIKKLRNEGIIQKLYAVLDTAKLGFTTYKAFLRLQNTGINKQNEIITYLKDHPHVQFLMSADGMFDLVFNILAKNVEELYDLFRDLENRYGNYIAEKEIIVMVFSSFFFRDYLVNKKSTQARTPVFFGSAPFLTKIDETDEKILSKLGDNARISFTDIAKEVDLTPDTVGIRVKKLEKTHVIQNYILLPNFSLMNQTSYKVMFALRDLTEKKEKEFLQYMKTQPNIWFHSKSLGKWDLEINMDVDNANQFRDIMMEIKSKFSDIIKGYNTLQVSKVHKFNFYPFEVY